MRIGPIAWLLVLPACELGAPSSFPDDADGAGDAGAIADYPDGAPGAGIDAGAASDASAPPSPDAGSGLFGEEDDACFDGLDNDANEAADCEDDGCSAAPYCCVGSAAPACCTGAGTSLSVDFDACAGTDPRGCAPSLVVFGGARLEGGALVPQGDAHSDGGLVLGPALDPTRERVELRARITAPADGCTDCLDVLALGLAGPPADGRVLADVAVMVRASRRDVALVVAGEAVASEALVDGAEHEYVLAIAPDGAVTLHVDGRRALGASASPRRDRVPMLFGRTHVPGDAPTARARSVSIRTSGCDIPAALRRDPRPTLPFDGVAWDWRAVANPSIAADGDGHLVAFSLDRAIHLARRAADGTLRLAGSGRVEAPLFVPEINDEVRDAELVREPTRWVLYATRQVDGEAPRIVRADGGEGHAESFTALEDVALPADVPWAESPAVLEHRGQRYLAARTEVDAETVIALFVAIDGRGAVFDWAAGSAAGSVLVRRGAEGSRFDQDEVADPDLLEDRFGLMRLYYAGRRGTRWSVGVRVSGDGLTWREPGAPLVLSGSGRGHDALGVRHPSVLLAGGRLELLYTASNGVTVAIGRAEGAAP
ncbi:MAG: hypothetical protein KF729_24960 [Sandaracinaceae bacterium]|nr:hypothetical protein [Sandaracinaceae bacterium]